MQAPTGRLPIWRVWLSLARAGATRSSAWFCTEKRDHGYRVAAWLEHALGAAQATVGVSRVEVEAEVGVETDAAVSVALQRVHRIAFYFRRGRTPDDSRELSDDARGLSPGERAQVAALAVAWWDGVLAALRARELERRARET